MSLRDDMKLSWEYDDTHFTPPNNPLLSKRLVTERVNAIKNMLLFLGSKSGLSDNDSVSSVIKGIDILIGDIEADKLAPGNL
tara:strand:+ start:113 stop:358 length:246 start_codon:yes stop_codon:yes gene_type:complete